jgi:hypothetical protein
LSRDFAVSDLHVPRNPTRAVVAAAFDDSLDGHSAWQLVTALRAT